MLCSKILVGRSPPMHSSSNVSESPKNASSTGAKIVTPCNLSNLYCCNFWRKRLQLWSFSALARSGKAIERSMRTLEEIDTACVRRAVKFWVRVA